MGNSAVIRSERMYVADYKVDYSEVTGKKVECIDECGLCCLCQPEVLPDEKPFFEKNYPKFLVKTKPPESYCALALKKGKGSCVFLENRRCKVYDNRTTYCRQFPYHIYVGEKVKVELDLSCRGAWTGKGADALGEAQSMIEKADSRIKQAVFEAAEVYKEFYANCREAGIMGDVDTIRRSVSENIANFTDLRYLSKVMEMSMMEPKMTLSAIKDGPADTEGIEEAAMFAAMESMATDDPLMAPIYCDEKWRWNVFLADEPSNRIDWMILDDDGDMMKEASVRISEIEFKIPEKEGAEVLREYISVLNGRDSFLGSVFALMDSMGYEDDMANAYYGCLSTAILDVMWRASMLDHFMGTGMGARGIREAIIFYDMDRLDAPAIGAFV
jgi:Predicted Fe-S-cluster oxidoreductase